jgi:hypothetical protein
MVLVVADAPALLSGSESWIQIHRFREKWP